MPIKRLRVHVTVPNRGQRLDTEEEAIKKPMGGPSRDAILLQTVKAGEENIEADVKGADKCGELRPPQGKQPAIDVAPFPRVGVNFDELDLTGPN